MIVFICVNGIIIIIIIIINYCYSNEINYLIFVYFFLVFIL
jgi:hypothetical protein